MYQLRQVEPPLINYSVGPYCTRIILSTSNYAELVYHALEKKSIQLFNISCNYFDLKFLDNHDFFYQNEYETSEFPRMIFVCLLRRVRYDKTVCFA